LSFATDLIKVLKRKFDFEITVSAYPEKHPDSKSIEQEYDVLKKKIDLGANKAITQFFFDVNSYFDYFSIRWSDKKRNIDSYNTWNSSSYKL
ncbi:MAG: methylenetetrahydrofolate reductase, partial [Alphaproteobacteria bacterium]